MKIAICGTDDKAFKIKSILDKLAYHNIVVGMFIGPDSIELCHDDIPIVPEKELLNHDYSEEIDGFIISPEHYGLTRLSIYKKLKTSVYANKKIYLPDFATLYNEGNVKDLSIEKILVPYEDSSQLFYLEVHAADHCNLNCKGCMHFSSLVKEKVFPDFNCLSEDVHQLRKFIKHIDIIRILGGEPLLNPELDRYITLLRETYPYANINIVTNGLLVANMSQSLCETIRNNEVHVHVSLYPPVKNKKDKIEAFLKDNGITFQISDCINTFTSTYQSKPFVDKTYAKEHCEIFCNNLRDGKISCCPQIIYTHYYNECFGTTYPVEDGMIDIYKIGSARELRQSLDKPVSLCSYCDRSNCFDWSITKRLNSEWLSKEECL